MNIHLMWFRSDLRLTDNEALYTACKNKKDTVLGIFTSVPKQWKKNNMSHKKAQFIYEHICSLSKDMFKIGIMFYYYEVNSNSVLKKLIVKFCLKHKVNSVFYNYQYEYIERKCDIDIENKLNINNISMNGFHGSLLFNPKKILTKVKNTYQVFHSFKKKIISKLNVTKFFIFPKPSRKKLNLVYRCRVYSFKFPRENFDKNVFPVGEKNALFKLKQFCLQKIKKYFLYRDYPALKSNSFLSPYLSIGVLSPKQCFLTSIEKEFDFLDNKFVFIWINELIWREFFKHLLNGYPILSKNKSLRKWEKKIVWKNNMHFFKMWKKGKTGYPIVDAGMKQLNKLGWINNRLRMITANFLVKNLLVDWRLGEKYFMSKLIDGDFSSNNGGWQWISSTGCDNVPYIRTFNPIDQCKKFDYLCKYIKSFLKELIHVPIYCIHNPGSCMCIQKKIIRYPIFIVIHNIEYKKFLKLITLAKEYE
ncbi:deoxyribodipyrimidine photo-lyase [Buchnera aphidicola]|uniref:Deoxyribodipyrimidine photo-lyase n=1 Tax=Buchnera aphidicola (Anoecia oenotherae) TaxID=1241833 RepID=A0A4D6XV41_9GAMM|nr:deoxyribodipyrimidine photo-lyase [Buchnera aphidicola]QCI19359.1 deoxyribodipyrimidine photo-lyase [Buchnera aphidicola (Anoecia oenotherae)]